MKEIFSKLKNKKGIFISVVVFIAVVSFVSVFNYSQGASLLPFGGRVTIVKPCTCSPGMAFMTISPPVGGLFAYQMGSQMYLNNNLGSGPGMWALGLYTPGPGTCYVGVPPYCSPAPTIGTISPTVGTSLAF